MTPAEVGAQVLALLGPERVDPEEPLAWERVVAWVQDRPVGERAAVRAGLLVLIDLDARNPAAEAEAPWMHVGLPSGMRLDDLLGLETAALVAGRLGWGEALPRLQAVLRDLRWHAVYPNVRQLQKELARVLAELGVTAWGRYQAAMLGAALGAQAAGAAAVWEHPLLRTLEGALAHAGDVPARLGDLSGLGMAAELRPQAALLSELVPVLLAVPAGDQAARGRALGAAVEAAQGQCGAAGDALAGLLAAARGAVEEPGAPLVRALRLWLTQATLDEALTAAGGDGVGAGLVGALFGLSLGLPGLPRRRLIDLPDRQGWVEKADGLAAANGLPSSW